MSTTLFVTADDRTGAFECGGIIAGEGFAVPTGPHAKSDVCCVVDIDTRQIEANDAAARIREAHRTEATYRAHKMDAGLRGNWAQEVFALAEQGHNIAIVPSFPDAGRRCKDGVVYIYDQPVLDSPFGQDPLTAPISNRPIEVLEHFSCLHDNIVIWDANDTPELNAAAQQCFIENRMMVGPAGAVGAFADQVLPERPRASVHIEAPVLIICGSLNANSRNQLDVLGEQILRPGDPIDLATRIQVVASEIPDGEITLAQSQGKALQMAAIARDHFSAVETLIIIGGDTSAAVVQDETLEVLGTVAAGIPISRFKEKLLITKGGGIGTAQALLDLLKDFQ